MNEITVLVTCVGSGVGQSVIDSLNLKREFKIIGCDGNANVYAHGFCDSFLVVPSLYTEGYTDYMLDLCLEHKVDILIPGHDHELVLFGQEYEKFKSKGVSIVVSKPDLIAVSRDKKEWYKFFIKRGCKIVPTVYVKEFMEKPDTRILPAIVKPSAGSASQGISIINDISELDGLNGDDIIQPYLFPAKSDKNYEKIFSAVKKGSFLQMSEISIQLTFSIHAKFSGIFISQNTLKSGVPVFVDPIDPDEFVYTDEILKFVPVLEGHGVRGPVNIQGRVTPEGLFFFEMNMRFTGITGNRALLGYNEVDFLVRNFLGMPCELNHYAYNKVGVRQVACTTIPRQGGRQQKETLAVLGGGSKVGEAYVRKHAEQYKCVNLIVRSISKQKYVEKFADLTNIQIISADDHRLEQLLCQTDVLLNFASALAYEDDTLKFDAVRFMHRLSVKVAKANIHKIVNISSQSVYPQDYGKAKAEEQEVRSNNAYAFQKIIMEEYFEAVKEFSPLSKVVSLRVSRIIAPQIPGQAGFFAKMVDMYKAGETVYIDHPEDNTNLIHIDDVASAITFVLKQMEENVDLPAVLNVGGDNISMRNYVDIVKNVVREASGHFNLGESTDVRRSSMIDTQKLAHLGWKATNSVENIVKEIVSNV